jgi:hypothetical protein
MNNELKPACKLPKMPKPVDTAYIEGPQGSEYRSVADSHEPHCAQYSYEQMLAYAREAVELNRRSDEQVRVAVRNQALEEAAIACFDIRFAREGFDRTSWNQGVIDCINAIRALQSTTPAEPVENGWLPIESAPVDKEILLTATLHSMLMPKPQRVVGRKDSRGGWWSTCGQTLSHMQCWQPLPPLPYSQRNE